MTDDRIEDRLIDAADFLLDLGAADPLPASAGTAAYENSLSQHMKGFACFAERGPGIGRHTGASYDLTISGRDRLRDDHLIDNCVCDYSGCSKLGGSGFAKLREPSHWFCLEPG
ncbi:MULTISPECIES: hypothetical protein [unclassified Mesorhizobium]|uniref:hypothetical protein n=1 Tax=unclassified Mesorhizobium TaxID=325217 RepID=UPI000FDC2DA2|nr:MULTISPECIES: hypothetical protein [unclassified Mesorhizobium]TGQ39450.1 hypothetical protein EN859_015850 [Mesorhizobium sp. M00.F.Ca.ET.216.01.1.1]TIS57498.1 MAG: hypothetical protein E5W91_13030 [Mesorhizobium sp.]TIS91852.1 MAG: hypothetical protein E5W89_06720 [Mesorhizobium sp.]TJW11690.1 MAG: hypothetical protein E5W82_18265 [Mesorhizobium sp.]TJW43768.1 MAG: hypothetical protein E5W83_16380 [Mesorhizobium sp.]